MKFSDISENVTVCIDPADSKTDVYVGPEHLDPEKLPNRRPAFLKRLFFLNF